VLVLTGANASADVTRIGDEVMLNSRATGEQLDVSLLWQRGQLTGFWSSSGFGQGNQVLVVRRQFSPTLESLGLESPVNPNVDPIGTHEQAPLAAIADGCVLAIWTNTGGGGGGDGDRSGVFGARIDDADPASAPLLMINQVVKGDQRDADVQSDGTSFVVVWMDEQVDGDQYSSRIVGRSFSGDCEAASLEFVVAPGHDDSWPSDPRIAINDGSAFVVWHALGVDGDADAVLGRRFSASGVPEGEPFIVNDVATGAQQFADIAVLATGEFVVVWQSSDASGSTVVGKRYSAQGLPIGAEFRVSKQDEGRHFGPNLTADLSGGFLVTWSAENLDGNGTGVFARRYHSDTQGGEQFRVNTWTPGDQVVGNNSAVFLSDNTFVVAWTDFSDRDGSASAVVAQRFELTAEGSRRCGDPYGSDLVITSADALRALRASVGLEKCARCVCDVDGSEVVDVSDAVGILRQAVGFTVQFSCAECD